MILKCHKNLNAHTADGKINTLTVNITPLRIKAAGIHQVLANQDTKMYLPLPAQLVEILYGTCSENLVDKVIKLLKQALNMPVLSQARIETALYSFMSRNICSSQIASIIAGRNLHKRADLWYCSHSAASIFAHYTNVIRSIAKNAQQKHVAHLNNTTITDHQYIGSQTAPAIHWQANSFTIYDKKLSMPRTL